MEDPDILSNFLSITGCEDSALATTILESNNWDVERSINFFFAMNDSHSTTAKPSSNNNSNNNSTRTSSPPASSFDYDEDDIREPIPQRMETLVDQMGDSMPSRPNRYQKPANVFEVFRDFEKERNMIGKGIMDKDKLTDKQKTLAELFKPPLDILTFGTFEAVKKIGEQKKQFILVNIQDVSEFDCQKLNRDTWSNKDLKELISENFVFWQVSNQNSEGNWFINTYPVYKFPYIAIIDPRTGQKLHDMFGFADAEEMAQYLVTFLSQNSYNGQITTSAINSNSSNSNGSDVASKKQRKYSTEDEELELAIQLSLKQDQEKAKNNSPPQDNKSPPLTNNKNNNNNNNNNNTSATTTTTNTTTNTTKDQLKNSKESIKKSSGDGDGEDEDEQEDEEFEENYDDDDEDIDNYDDNYFYSTTVEKTKSEEEIKQQEIKQLVEKVQESSKIGTEGDCTIQIRCPSETLKGQFHSTDQIKTLYYYVQVKTGLANFKLLTSYPKVELVGDIMTKTLKEMDLAPRAVIMLQQN